MPNIEWIVIDVDGTLTDGVIHYDSAGNEHKHFHVADGMGIAMAHAVGLKTTIVSARSSPMVERRMAELGVTEVLQAVGDKATALRAFMHQRGLVPDQLAFIGDDLNDLPAFGVVGFKIAVADAAEIVRAKADFVTARRGGYGAVRDAIEEILRRLGLLEESVAAYLRQSTARGATNQ